MIIQNFDAAASKFCREIGDIFVGWESGEVGEPTIMSGTSGRRVLGALRQSVDGWGDGVTVRVPAEMACKVR